MKTFKFYGIDGNYYKLDDVVWEALEDESDGYRSYLKSIEKIDNPERIFFKEPIAEVNIIKVNGTEEGEFSGYRLIDIEDNHVWLEIGTSYYDAWYPQFTFKYNPKMPQSEEISSDKSEKIDEWKKFIQ